MALAMDVPVVHITLDNFHQLLPELQSAIGEASFIALDAELSGIGAKRALNSFDMHDRYKAMVELAHSRAMLSLGIACFTNLHVSPLYDSRL